MTGMTIFHGQPSQEPIQKCREAAPSYRHGAEWVPGYMTDRDWPWIYDNGVYSAWANDTEWDSEGWLESLDSLADMPREPTFVTLPDVVGDADATYKRTRQYVDAVPDEYRTAFAVQDGMAPETACNFAVSHGCDWVFVGGSVGWKRKFADRFVMTAHDRDLKCHIARPSLPDGLMWADRIGADSVDTTTIVRNQAYHHLETLENQTRVSEYER